MPRNGIAFVFLLIAAACSAESATESAPPRDAQPVLGTFTVELDPSAPATRARTSVKIGTGTDQVELTLLTRGTGLAGCGQVNTFCVTERVTSHFDDEELEDVTVILDGVSPVTATSQNSDPLPSYLVGFGYPTNLGVWNYGDLSPGESAVREWRLNWTSGRVYVHGKILANINESVGETNLALGGTATMSNPHPENPASRAIDGNTSGDYADGSVAHNSGGEFGYLDVDLGSVRDITNVTVWNRTDCCMERLDNWYLFVSDTPFESTDPFVTEGSPGVFSAFHAPAPNPSTTVAVNRTGRYVRVQMQGNDFLQVAELQVFGF